MTTVIPNTSLDLLNASLMTARADLASVPYAVGKTLAATGQQFTISSDVKFDQAKAYRFNGAMLFDVLSPMVSFNTKTCIVQANDYHLQASNSRLTAINATTRVENINVLISHNNFQYAQGKLVIAAPVSLAQSDYHNLYASSGKFQFGQTTGLSLSNSSDLGDLYGKLEIGATKDITLVSQYGGMGTYVADKYSVDAQKNLTLKSGGSFALSAYAGGVIHSEATLALSSAVVIASANTSMSISAKATMTINGGVIHLNSGQSLKPPVDLDGLSDLTNADISLAGDNLDLTQATDLTNSLGTIDPSNITFTDSATLDTLIAQGSVPPTTTLADLNTLTAAITSLGTVTNAADILSQAFKGNISLADVGTNLTQILAATNLDAGNYGEFLTNLVRGATEKTNLIFGTPVITASGFTFDPFPLLTTLPLYDTTPMNNPTQGINSAGSSFNSFPVPTSFIA